MLIATRIHYLLSLKISLKTNENITQFISYKTEKMKPILGHMGRRRPTSPSNFNKIH